MNSWKRAYSFLTKDLWRVDLDILKGGRAFLVKTLRLLAVSSRDFSEGLINLRAMSLVYTTLLSLVPLLAVSFSVLKGFGVHNQIEPLLLNFLAPLGPKGGEIAASIIGFVENLNVKVLGAVGLAVLLYTVFSLIQKIEDAFNDIWRVRRQRSLARKISDYMSVLLIGPVLIALGAEGDGVPPEVVAACDASVRIPMAPAFDCFNVATAGAIFLYEIARRRRR